MVCFLFYRDSPGLFCLPLQGLRFQSSGSAMPGRKAAGQNSLHCGPVEVAEELMWQVDSPQSTVEMKLLLGFFNCDM